MKESQPILDYQSLKPKAQSRRVLALAITAIALLLFFVLFVASGMEPTGRVAIARHKSTVATISNLSTALEAFKKDIGRYPTTTEGLDALSTCPVGIAGWKGPYIDDIPTDAWGTNFHYEFPTPTDPTQFQITSNGPDLTFGTTDDINRSTRP